VQYLTAKKKRGRQLDTLWASNYNSNHILPNVANAVSVKIEGNLTKYIYMWQDLNICQKKKIKGQVMQHGINDDLK
jgi:hypothetical protein